MLNLLDPIIEQPDVNVYELIDPVATGKNERMTRNELKIPESILHTTKETFICRAVLLHNLLLLKTKSETVLKKDTISELY